MIKLQIIATKCVKGFQKCANDHKRCALSLDRAADELNMCDAQRAIAIKNVKSAERPAFLMDANSWLGVLVGIVVGGGVAAGLAVALR